MEAHFGIRPPEPPEGVKDRKTSGVSSAWLKQNFNHCPQGAPQEAVERYARVWLWHLLGGFLFPDGSGNTISWMVLPILGQQWENIAQYSWGSAALGWLYRQLCDACWRDGNDSNLGGCAYLLQIWIWERFPVGRPYRGELEVILGLQLNFEFSAHYLLFLTLICLPLQAWPHHDPESRPTVAYCWKNIGAVRGDPLRRYMRYMDDLDCLTQNQVLYASGVFK